MPQPELVVFDLDLTLWECGHATWCDCLSPPFRRKGNQVVDRQSNRIRLFDGVGEVMAELDNRDIKMAIASRTQEPSWAEELLSLFGIDHRFAYSEIYPESKLSHFSSLRSDSGVPFEQMLFFDDEWRNIRDVSTLGVTCQHVADGMSQTLFLESMDAFGR